MGEPSHVFPTQVGNQLREIKALFSDVIPTKVGIQRCLQLMVIQRDAVYLRKMDLRLRGDDSGF